MGSPWLYLLLLPPSQGRHGEQSLKASHCLHFGQMPRDYDDPGGVTANSSGTVTSTTSPGSKVLCAMTEAIATNFACRLVGGPRMNVRGVVIFNVTVPEESSLTNETCAPK